MGTGAYEITPDEPGQAAVRVELAPPKPKPSASDIWWASYCRGMQNVANQSDGARARGMQQYQGTIDPYAARGVYSPFSSQSVYRGHAGSIYGPLGSVFGL